MADKDVAGIVTTLGSANALRGARVIATRVLGERALPAEVLAARWRALGARVRVEAAPEPAAALEAALAGATGPVVVAGSLYLVGEIRARLVDDPDLRDPA